MVGLFTTGNYVLVHLVMEDFGLASFSWHYWEGLVVDYLPMVDYFLGTRVDYF